MAESNKKSFYVFVILFASLLVFVAVSLMSKRVVAEDVFAFDLYDSEENYYAYIEFNSDISSCVFQLNGESPGWYSASSEGDHTWRCYTPINAFVDMEPGSMEPVWVHAPNSGIAYPR
mgnify:CR=1 FL=1